MTKQCIKLLEEFPERLRDKLITKAKFDVRLVKTYKYKDLCKAALTLVKKHKRVAEYCGAVNLELSRHL